MKIRSLAGAAVAAALAVSPAVAQAAPIKVNVRVEGKSRTLFERNVMTDVHPVTGDDTGPHKCDGTNGGAHPNPVPTLTGAFDSAMAKGDISWHGTWNAGFEDFLIDRVGPDSSTSTKFWGTVLNWEDTQVGGCQQRVRARDRVLVAFDSFGKPKLRLGVADSRVDEGDLITFKVVNGTTGDPVKGAKVAGTGKKTSSAGRVFLRIDNPGKYQFKALKSGTVRSNARTVRVG